MAQWERLKQLDLVCLQRLDELYQTDVFPMAILLENLDYWYSRFVQENNFLMHRNFRHLKQQFQKYQEDPCRLAEVISWFLGKEREILEAAELAQEVQMLQVQPNTMELETQKTLEKNIRDFKNKVQVMEHSLRCLEEQQDEFDFKYQTHVMDGTTDEMEKQEQIKVLKGMMIRLNNARKTFLSEMESLLNTASQLLSIVLDELEKWKRRQQVSCIGAPEDTNLEPLEKCAFVVETQPSMPQGRGSLVLRTNVQFSVKTRFLFKVPELNHAMKVVVSIDKYRKFNVLGTSSKTLNMSESMNGGMVADFRHLTLKERKVGAGGKGNNDNLVFFANPPMASWSQLGQMLSWQFQSSVKRGLDGDQLQTLAKKLFGKKENFENCKISWTRFIKKVLLQKKQGGTFLLRFSESIRDGGITFSWVEYSNTGKPSVRTVQPFTSVDLKQIPFPEILRNFQIMEAENAPVYPLQFLYPNTPKDQAFGKYYSEKTGDPPSPPEVSDDVSDDIMLLGPENSPMLSGCGDSPALSTSDVSGGFLDTLDFITDPLADIPLKGSHNSGHFMDMLSEAIFFSDPSILHIQGE
ncbi:Signal transducer and activator of transcription 3.2 [Bagarius yarrelli]|uniref:Signal transducer and activator of transcription 3.2 n=1 Tax=Bagarius yarrelli TaxID=175774 RepID=A0A556V6Q6_BAGYA|nr:Signal transducer and activator of transcription 3.2 [Bagarius yarrelli]